MEIKHIKELMTAMGRTGTKRLLIKKEGLELELERQESGRFRLSDMDSSDESILSQDNNLYKDASAILRAKEAHGAANSSLLPSQPSKTDDATALYVTSPMVGTFYASQSPDDPSFVKTGDKIEKNTVVCIIEAMKVMNEIKAGASGTLAEVLVESGHPVEFGTKLFRIT